ncbi:MAG: hypothetical protein M3522_03260 [Actinomycetota bacterium]|nr:hypothetical protein [Actinomycetota bacterium]
MSERNRAVSPDDAETLYVAAIHSTEAVRGQLLRMGLDDTTLEDAAFVRDDLLREVEKLRREASLEEG